MATAAVSRIAELLAGLVPNGGASRANPIQAAPDLAQMVVQAQKDQRSAPFEEALRKVGNAWGTAKTAKDKANLNSQADKIRADYVNSGGSPVDIDESLWGSDPSKGFDVGTNKFLPGYAGDNMSMGQKLRLSEVTGNYEGKPTWAKQVGLAELTGMFGGQKTWPRQYQERNLGQQDQQLDISRGNLGVAQGNLQLQTDYKDFQMDQNQFQQDSSIATNRAINEIAKLPDETKAWEYIGENAGYFASAGVDTSSLIAAIAKRWPKADATGSDQLIIPGMTTNP